MDTIEKGAGIFAPKLDKHFIVKSETTKLLTIVEEMVQEQAQNVIVVGPQGCGKTSLALHYAASRKKPAIVINCAMVRETRDWMGWRTIRGGSIIWEKSAFVRAIEQGDVVVVLDEFNRLHSTLHNSIYPLLDERRESFVEEIQETVKVGPGTLFFATVNVGLSHVGTFVMDSSMEDRWGIRVDVSFLSKKDEEKVLIDKTGVDAAIAKKLAHLASDVRKKASGIGASFSRSISTRQLLMSAELMKRMKAKRMKVVQALDYTIVPFYSTEGGTESEQAQLLQLVQGIFGDL
jgi:MoxR-like ATPase